MNESEEYKSKLVNEIKMNEGKQHLEKRRNNQRIQVTNNDKSNNLQMKVKMNECKNQRMM